MSDAAIGWTFFIASVILIFFGMLGIAGWEYACLAAGSCFAVAAIVVSYCVYTRD